MDKYSRIVKKSEVCSLWDFWNEYRIIGGDLARMINIWHDEKKADLQPYYGLEDNFVDMDHLRILPIFEKLYVTQEGGDFCVIMRDFEMNNPRAKERDFKIIARYEPDRRSRFIDRLVFMREEVDQFFQEHAKDFPRWRDIDCHSQCELWRALAENLESTKECIAAKYQACKYDGLSNVEAYNVIFGDDGRDKDSKEQKVSRFRSAAARLALKHGLKVWDQRLASGRTKKEVCIDDCEE